MVSSEKTNHVNSSSEHVFKYTVAIISLWPVASAQVVGSFWPPFISFWPPFIRWSKLGDGMADAHVIYLAHSAHCELCSIPAMATLQVQLTGKMYRYSGRSTQYCCKVKLNDLWRKANPIVW